MKITLYEGNSRNIIFRLRRRGQVAPADVSAADSIDWNTRGRTAPGTHLSFVTLRRTARTGPTG